MASSCGSWLVASRHEQFCLWLEQNGIRQSPYAWLRRCPALERGLPQPVDQADVLLPIVDTWPLMLQGIAGVWGTSSSRCWGAWVSPEGLWSEFRGWEAWCRLLVDPVMAVFPYMIYFCPGTADAPFYGAQAVGGVTALTMHVPSAN